MKKMLFLSKNWHFSVQKALIYYTFNKSHHNSYILLVFSHVANFRYVVNFRFLTLYFNSQYNNMQMYNIYYNIKLAHKTNISEKWSLFEQTPY